MHERERAPRSPAGSRAGGSSTQSPAGVAGVLLDLQGRIGNRATTLVARSVAPGATPPSPPVAPGRGSASGTARIQRVTEPLTPEEMYRTLTAETMFHEGTGRHRAAVVGHGSATRAMIQVIDAEGERVAVVLGRNRRGLHAEQDALAELDRQIAGGTIDRNRLRGGRLVVVVNQDPCADVCTPALRAQARRLRLERVDSHVFEREALVGGGHARPRATFTTQTRPRVGERQLAVRRRDIPIYDDPSARRAIRGPVGGRRGPRGRRRGGRGRAGGATAIALLLTLAFNAATSRALAQAANEIRARRRRSSGRPIRVDGIDLYNVEDKLSRTFDRPDGELDQARMNEFSAAVDHWVARDYRPGGQGSWQRWFETRFARGVQANDTDLLGGELMPWVDGGLLGDRGNVQYAASAITVADALLSERRDRYAAAADAGDELSDVSFDVFEEQIQGLVLDPDDAYLLWREAGRLGRARRHYVSALVQARARLREAHAVERDRFARLERAVAVAYERRG